MLAPKMEMEMEMEMEIFNLLAFPGLGNKFNN